MLTMMLGSLGVILFFALALGFGQFIGRAPLVPKCNPDTCCMNLNMKTGKCDQTARR
jgi:hypothetical protein